ncbi:TPA: gfo/Idh/MocA family oxidoreductase [Candidatus Poribacteria bacterium]|nr:gfo/Idh/MocA family oxidoreductase [Candidatus Poribacteria bacterium]
MIKVGILGAGTMGSMHASCYSQIPDVKVVAIADKRRDIAQKVAEPLGAEVFEEAEELIEKAEVDIIDVCMPTPLHKEFVLKAARSGRHVFCEKPLALSVQDGEEMVEACKKAGVKFMVGHVLRYFHEYVAIKRQIDAGAIGRPAVIRSSRCTSQPIGWQDWYKRREMSGGVCLDLIIHDFDFLRWCFGEVERVFAKGAMYDREIPVDYALVTLRFKNGVIAHVEGSWAHSGFFTTFEAAGSEGLICFDSRTSSPFRIFVKTQAEGKAAVEVPESPVNVSPYFMEIDHFVGCVREDKEPEITGQDALEAIRMGIAALESIKTGKPVTL